MSGTIPEPPQVDAPAWLVLYVEMDKAGTSRGGLLDAYRDRDLARTQRLLASLEFLGLGDDASTLPIEEWPSLAFDYEPADPDDPLGSLPDFRQRIESALPWLVYRLRFETAKEAQDFHDRVGGRTNAIFGDAVIAPFDSWCPGESAAPEFFATRERADLLIGASALTASPPILRGQEVNLVIMDQGFSLPRLKEAISGLRYGGGFPLKLIGGPPVDPGKAPPTGHGTMVARNALALAPEARIWDFPMIPKRITNVTGYISWACAALVWLYTIIFLHRLQSQLLGRPVRPWVLSNAWGIPDRRFEIPRGTYTTTPGNLFNVMVGWANDLLHVDQVYAAGNCGQFCPVARCGPGDRGPGRSIWGANSHPKVLSVGAVRADGIWLGYSSQGPGQKEFVEAPAVNMKPDLCAPSQFVDDDDAAFVSSGTSAACGIAAGAIAALRSAGGPAANAAAVTPDAIRALLRTTANQTEPGAAWNIRLGYGILDLSRAVPQLPSLPPAATATAQAGLATSAASTSQEAQAAPGFLARLRRWITG